ncbi:alpha/beta fold hydrolase [Phreatobacter sp. AB_2022a]|uniref:alpha/beta fold hydrolase n=1 Tax=Phreatobacter sp. AB_2022a TaxID=3003134 RepID=UPI00228719AD|nr:alpha/beta hydrolase [Phreatobacter sp. AB_2022a]MCZ0735645.1 alpha/beta hydrolase [Phreatobacter sp. AB_2022a]
MSPSRRVVLAGLAGLAAGSPGKAQASDRADASAPPTALFTVHSRDGTQLSGQAQGDRQSPEILFIHGLRQSRLSWDKQFADPALAGFRLVSFDLRGHGDSDKPAALEAYSEADRWADDVAAVIAAAGLRRPVLVGWSLGGFVAGAYLRKYGGSGIAGINLVDAVTRLSPDLLGEDSARFGRTTVSHDLAERTAATAEFLAACFHQPPGAADMQRMLVVNGMAARAVGEGFVKTETADLEPVFQAYAGPILLTHGRHDRLVRLAMSERIKAMHANSRLSVFDASGHSPFYEEPERYGRELAEFVRAAARG